MEVSEYTIRDYWIARIKVAKNPYPDTRGFVAQREAFEEARKVFIKLLKEV